MLPSLQLLEKVSKGIMSVPNRKKESKRKVHFCCFLLCSKAGLRVSEAVSFDLENKTRQVYIGSKSQKAKKKGWFISLKKSSEN